LTLTVSWTTATVTFNPTPAAASGGPVNGAWVGLWNYYNRILVGPLEQDSKASWTYTGAAGTWRAQDGGSNNLNNRITFVIGPFTGPPYVEDYVASQLMGQASTAAAAEVSVGIGLNSTASPSCNTPDPLGYAAGVVEAMMNDTCSVLPSAGENYLQALEWYSTTGTMTGYGSNNGLQVQGMSAQLRY
jgi:hypothetical protein